MIVKTCYNNYGDSAVESYISDLYLRSVDKGVRVSRNYDLLVESFPEITDEIREHFMRNPECDFILENLQSHDFGRLKKVLLQEYSDKIRKIICEDDTDKSIAYIYFNDIFVMDKMVKDDKKFKNILEFYGYFITHTKRNIVIVEPKYTERADSYIYGDCHGIVYHITYKDIAYKIAKTGLRCKAGSDRKGVYREFPKRIYVSAIDPSTVNCPIVNILRDISHMLADTVSDKAALKINLTKIHIPFYADKAMMDEISYFTYNNIPPECIEKVIPL